MRIFVLKSEDFCSSIDNLQLNLKAAFRTKPSRRQNKGSVQIAVNVYQCGTIPMKDYSADDEVSPYIETENV